jgi:hypothetical protein
MRIYNITVFFLIRNFSLIMIPKPILVTFRNLPSMNILGRAQSLIFGTENNVDTYTKFAVNAKEYNQVDRICPSSAKSKSLLLQYTFSSSVHYCQKNYTCFRIPFHLLYDVLVVFDYLESRHLPLDKLLLASPTANSSHSNFSRFD